MNVPAFSHLCKSTLSVLVRYKLAKTVHLSQINLFSVLIHSELLFFDLWITAVFTYNRCLAFPIYSQ